MKVAASEVTLERMEIHVQKQWKLKLLLHLVFPFKNSSSTDIGI